MRRRVIVYTIVGSALGRLLVAATERGVCHVRFGGDDAVLVAELAGELPFAPLERDDRALHGVARALALAAQGEPLGLRIPLDVSGSRFEQRVWRALRRIPVGATRTYAEVAAAVGVPRGARAVARACAANPVALLVPCHRVVPASGAPGGYRWGAERKRSLLEREAVAREAVTAARRVS